MKTEHAVLAVCVIVVILVSGFFVGTDLLNKPQAFQEPAPTSTPSQTSSPNPTDNPTSSTTSPSPSPNPKSSTNPTPTPTPTETASPSASPSPTPAPTATPMLSPSPTSTPSPTVSPSPSPTPSPSPSPTSTPSPTVSPSPSPTPSPSPSPSPDLLSVSYPNGGQDWVQGVNHNIAWSYSGTGAANVKIELFKGGVLNRIMYSSTENDGHASWSVPADQMPGTNYKIKISTISSSPITDMSDDYFTIHEPGTITLTSPNGGEKWVRGTSHDITWSTSGYVGTSIDIELLRGGVYDSIVRMSANNNGLFSWSVPADQMPGTNYKIKITSTGFDIYDGFSDSSEEDFEIAAGIVTVTSPNGGENWGINTDHTITWTDSGSGPAAVNIYLYKGGSYYCDIMLSAPNTGSFTWSIISAYQTGSDYQISIVGMFDSTSMVSDLSDSYFTLSRITVTRPNGGEEWARGSDYEITWSSSGSVGTNVIIELLKYGTLDSTVVFSTPNDGSYVWRVDDWKSLRTDYSIRIRSSDDLSIADSSDEYFSIIGIIVTDPNGGDYWERGMSHAITWSSLGNVGSTVRIELLNNGVPEVLSSSVANNGFYGWFIPYDQEIGYEYTIRITSVLYSWISGTSNGNFDVVPNYVNVISPNGGENWVRGSSHTITWSEDASSALANIYLYKGGVFYSNIVLGTADDGSYDWVIPSSHEGGTDFSVKIESTTATQWSDLSDGYFAISGLTVTSPNTGRESYDRGSYAEITWTTVGITGSNVKIELFKSGALYYTIASSTPNVGSFSGQIPSFTPTGTDYKIKITSITYPTISDYSNANFEIT